MMVVKKVENGMMGVPRPGGAGGLVWAVPPGEGGPPPTSISTLRSGELNCKQRYIGETERMFKNRM